MPRIKRSEANKKAINMNGLFNAAKPEYRERTPDEEKQVKKWLRKNKVTKCMTAHLTVRWV